MAQNDIAGFRRLCGRFRWLAIFMVVSVSVVLALVHVIGPLVLGLRGVIPDFGHVILGQIIRAAPSICYLFGVWSIGRAMGQLQEGRLIQPTLASALRRVGLMLVIGGVLQVFVVTNLLRLIAESRGGYLYWDVGAMTLGMIGGALFLLGRVVDQADHVQAELDEMI
ncbi:DUF2975 domain-containing protein [Brevundimonas sp. C43]|jgi:hypothetical protein|uniref:DUF2975 domain-containing protein n=1 Tax=Brevundimonas sp. C43 TaxID=3068314 RepID=UPI00273D44BD|nr:DUF2975 domain-containing protein [Brevundimonas sp. C43]